MDHVVETPAAQVFSDEYKLLLKEASQIYRSPPLREAIELAVHTGLRRGNLLSLRWEWIDWLSRVIRVRIQRAANRMRCR